MTDLLDQVFTVAIVGAVVLTVLAVSLELEPRRLRTALRSWRTLVLALLVNLLLLPIITLATLVLLPLSQATLVAVFLVTVGAGGALGLKVADLTGRADLALAVALVVVLQGADVVAVPLWAHAVAGPASVEPRAVATNLAALVLVPLVLGLIVAARVPRLRARGRAVLAMLATVALLVALAAGTVGNWAQIRPLLLSAVSLAAAVVTLAGLVLGWGVGGGDGSARHLAGSAVTASRFASLGLVVIGTQTNGADQLLGPAITAALVNLVLVIVLAAVVGRRRQPLEADTLTGSRHSELRAG